MDSPGTHVARAATNRVTFFGLQIGPDLTILAGGPAAASAEQQSAKRQQCQRGWFGGIDGRWDNCRGSVGVDREQSTAGRRITRVFGDVAAPERRVGRIAVTAGATLTAGWERTVHGNLARNFGERRGVSPRYAQTSQSTLA